MFVFIVFCVFFIVDVDEDLLLNVFLNVFVVDRNVDRSFFAVVFIFFVVLVFVVMLYVLNVECGVFLFFIVCLYVFFGIGMFGSVLSIFFASSFFVVVDVFLNGLLNLFCDLLFVCCVCLFLNGFDVCVGVVLNGLFI